MVGIGPATLSEKIMESAFNIENWMAVGAACVKMAGFFWPVALAAVPALAWLIVCERRAERAARLQ